jgi:hypothetical protein
MQLSLTIPTVPYRTAVPQLDTELLHERLRAYQEEQQRVLQAKVEHRAVQQRGKLTGKRATVEAQLAKLHHRRSALEIEQAVMTTREEVLRPTFASAS